MVKNNNEWLESRKKLKKRKKRRAKDGRTGDEPAEFGFPVSHSWWIPFRARPDVVDFFVRDQDARLAPHIARLETVVRAQNDHGGAD